MVFAQFLPKSALHQHPRICRDLIKTIRRCVMSMVLHHIAKCSWNFNVCCSGVNDVVTKTNINLRKRANIVSLYQHSQLLQR